MKREKTWPSLRFDFETGARLGPGKAILLELIRDHGSIRAAGAAIGMSYRRAWLLADEMNRMFTQPVVTTQHGGKSGGGAELTAFGAELLARYRAMEDKAAEVYAGDLDWLAEHMEAGFKKPEQT